MPKRARKHPGAQGAPRPPRPARPHRERVNFYVDDNTVQVLDSLVNDTPEIENRSAAIRYLARWYEMTAQGNPGQ
jgi:hypothetical protein